MMADLLFFDSTLRDGSHAVKHQISTDLVEEYCKLTDGSGMYTIIVGHGNGLGASSLQVGLSKHTDHELLSVARANIMHSKLGVYMIPGFATIKDNMQPAIEDGVELFCVGCHCTEADITKQHLEFARNHQKEAYGVLMMYHMASTREILTQALNMQSYGAMGVILMDSAGASTPELVKKTIATLADHLDIRIGFHPHNNLGLAVANAYVAVSEGATILDGTLKGFGAGAGNCPLEALLALLEKEQIITGIDLYQILDAGNMVADKLMVPSSGLTDISIISGIAGVFSSFATQVKQAARQFQVNPRDIFLELGRRKAIGGQEDMIVEIAVMLKNKKEGNVKDYLLQSLL